jgi:hypothetical protein
MRVKTMSEIYEIGNCSDFYTLLYGYIGNYLLTAFGLEGETVLRRATRAYGADRGTATRERHLQAGAKINMENLFSLYFDLPSDRRFKRNRQVLQPEARVSHTLYCPMAAIWEAKGLKEIGRIYCEEFHTACYEAYAYGYTRVNLSETLTQDEDRYCSFNIILRPEDLPDELLPVCFSSFDPQYVEPDFPVIEIGEKDGFKTLTIKVYAHLFKDAVETFGDQAKTVIAEALSVFFKEIFADLREQAIGHNRVFNRTFIFENIPFDEKTADDDLWKTYDQAGAKDVLMQVFRTEIDLVSPGF